MTAAYLGVIIALFQHPSHKYGIHRLTVHGPGHTFFTKIITFLRNQTAGTIKVRIGSIIFLCISIKYNTDYYICPFKKKQTVS
jgi:hypothetical protein